MFRKTSLIISYLLIIRILSWVKITHIEIIDFKRIITIMLIRLCKKWKYNIKVIFNVKIIHKMEIKTLNNKINRTKVFVINNRIINNCIKIIKLWHKKRNWKKTEFFLKGKALMWCVKVINIKMRSIFYKIVKM